MRNSCILFFAMFSIAISAQSNIKLPSPKRSGGMPLMEALNARCSERSFSNKAIDKAKVGNLLWAAFGYNRTSKRTAPSAMNKQSVEIYVATPEAVYLYNAEQHTLLYKVSGDYRKQTGMQPFVGSGYMELIYVAKAVQGKRDMLYADCGFIAQNVYLFCASEGLATVVRGSVPRAEVAKILGIDSEERILLCQTVGYSSK